MQKVDLTQFDYEKVGRQDAEMWRAYYNHQFFKLFWMLLRLIKDQLGLDWLTTLRLAYYSSWAAADYRIHRGNVNNKRVLKNITKYYKLISKHAAEPFNYKKAGEYELVWWDVHRKSYTNNAALEQSLADGAGFFYNIEPSKLKDYAHYRAEAMILPRHKGDSANNPIDWPKIEELTIKSWQALHAAVQPATRQ
jgi:hypothetical protein